MWKHKKDNSEEIITAKKYINSSHKSEENVKLPPEAVVFCIGSAMEASALLSVSKYYGIEPNVILLVSDKHPINKADKDWNWGNPDFKSIKNKFIINSIKYASYYEQII